MSFFIRRSSEKRTSKSKLKKPTGPAGKKDVGLRYARKRKAWDEEIDSESEVDSDEATETRKAELVSSDEEAETAQEKKLRLTKQYLAQLEASEADREDEDGGTRDAISHRLKQDQLELAGKLQREVADLLEFPDSTQLRELRGHRLPVTCIVISPDSKHIFSGSKDCSLIKWCAETGKKLKVIPGGKKGTEKTHVGHTAHILSLAISTDGKFLASGDRNNIIHIWDPNSMESISTLTGHRDAVSGLAFRKGSHQLFSASHDRSVKVWNLDEMAYVETLFGHQDCLTGVDSLTRDRAVTSGGRDRTVRVWKIIEESQLIFNGHVGCGSIDCVSLINESTFVTGADDNSVSLWSVNKKKPLTTVKQAHKTETGGYQENWISAVVSLQNTDVVVSGSRDGAIRFWKCGAEFKSLTCIASIPVKGFVNSLQFSGDGRMLVGGVGQEHRLGRWWRDKTARNSIVIIPIMKKS
ncbi:U3 small nucleolar RNA-interacting protein 2-like isoform X2 [Haliotis asinina]|uniref:U3 small nucleolar RNA-interacting protein 2-like isoform X2 n=1 Tax=Haliotis asinina TaxID=109174 RepID=UPI003531D45D